MCVSVCVCVCVCVVEGTLVLAAATAVAAIRRASRPLITGGHAKQLILLPDSGIPSPTRRTQPSSHDQCTLPFPLPSPAEITQTPMCHAKRYVIKSCLF